MKVLHLLSGYGVGGIGTMVYSLVRAQTRVSRLEPAILYSRLSDRARQKHAETGADMHVVKLSGGYDVSPVAAYRLRKLFRQYDVLHFHYFHPMYSLCSIGSGARTVYTFHGNFGFHRKKTIKDHVKNALLAKFVKNFVDFITYNSSFSRRTAEDMYSITNARCEIVHNGLEIERISGNPSHLPPDTAARLRNKFMVGACGRLVRMKRIDRLIDAFAQFGKRKSDVALVIVGDGILRQDLQDQIDALGLSDTALITGYQDNAQDYEAAMDVCAMPSSGEPFGLVALEALAMGKPTVVFEDGGGVVEIIKDCVAEDVVSSVDGMAARLEHYYRNRTPQTDRAAHFRRHAQRFHIDATTAKFTKVYERVLSGRARGQ